MAVNLSYPEDLNGVPGVLIGVAATGKKDKDDLVIIKFEDDSRIAGVFTNSAFAAPPVILAKARQNSCRAWIINSGNANAATGEPEQRTPRSVELSEIIDRRRVRHAILDEGSVNAFRGS